MNKNKEEKQEKEKKPRKKTIKIRLDDDVYNQLQELKQLGKFNTWQEVLIHLQHNKKGFKKVLVDENGDSLKCLNHLSSIGNNLNQVAKVANQNKKISVEELKKIRSFYNDTIKIKNYFCKKIIPNFKNGSEK